MKKRFTVKASSNMTSRKRGKKIMAASGTAYDYMQSIVDDVKEYINDNINTADYDDIDDLEQELNDDLWAEDSVTGNGSGSYTMNRAKAYEYLIGDSNTMDYIRDLCSEFGVEAKDVAEHFLNEDYEWFDVSIRCYLLGQAIAHALEELGLR
jgi:hypothetical protein